MEILLRNIKTLLEATHDGAQRSRQAHDSRHTERSLRWGGRRNLGPATAQSQAASDYSGKTMAVETIHYNGYRPEVVPVGKGWRVSTYPPESALALRESPAILEKVLKETVIAEAKKIVDARGTTD